jgi:Glyoxalase-like domain
MATVNFIDETTAGERGTAWRLEIFEESLPLREVIRRRVFQQVAEHNEDYEDWVVIGLEPGQRLLAFQRTEVWNPPEYHNPGKPQQLHVDIRVDDIDAAEQAILKLDAVRLKGKRETGFRVYADPAGHPFCLVFGGENE